MKPQPYWESRLPLGVPGAGFRSDGQSAHFDINFGAFKRGPSFFVNELQSARRACIPWNAKLRKNQFVDSPVGDPPMLGGQTLTAIHNAVALGEIAGWIESAGPRKPTILEIGGGFGGLARAALDEWRSSEVTLVDFPVMLALQQWYLEMNGFADGRASYVEAGALLDGRYDVAVNMNSFCEMALDQVHFYRDQLARAVKTGGIFISVNHFQCVGAAADEWGFEGAFMRMKDRPFPHWPDKRGALTIWLRE